MVDVSLGNVVATRRPTKRHNGEAPPSLGLPDGIKPPSLASRMYFPDVPSLSPNLFRRRVDTMSHNFEAGGSGVPF